MSEKERAQSVISEYIRTATYPVAVKLSPDPVLPEKTRRPQKAFGYPLALCQGVALTRRFGWTMGFLKEDHACPVAHVIMGLAAEPDFIQDGSIVYPLYAETLAAGARTQQATPKMPVGEIGSIVLAPLHRADFAPDVLLIYGNPAQMARLIQGALYKEGGALEAKFAGRGACGGEIVVPYKEQRYNLIIPGGGEKAFAMAADDEMVFAAPWSKVPDLLDGIVATHKAGAVRLPSPFLGTMMKPNMPKEYGHLAQYCGLK